LLAVILYLKLTNHWTSLPKLFKPLILTQSTKRE